MQVSPRLIPQEETLAGKQPLLNLLLAMSNSGWKY